MTETQIGPAGSGVAIADDAIVPEDIKDDITRFMQDGFIGPVKLYEPDEAAEILREVRVKNQDTTHSVFNNSMNYDRHLDIPELSRHVTHPTILKYLNAILGPDVLSWRTEFFAKFPGSRGTEWHQVRDYSYATGKPQLLPTESDWNAYIDITVWTTFTPATKRTGCMKFVRGSHRERIFDEAKSPARGREARYGTDHVTTFTKETGFYGYDFSDFAVDPDWEPRPEDVAEVELQPGEALIFTASCVHGSLPNITERETRFAITSRYVPTHVRVYPDQTSYTAHGHDFDLKDYGAVLVSGRDTYGHNRLRTTNAHGEPFALKNTH
ncbi:chlorinating enzyme [Streptomyces sp. NPDC093261]|uniref:chlorinating enzyme n=1 Tax=Streptomyces sp. NPDC093261 TaxID=3366037 RepID=UPI00381ECF01